MKRYEYMMRNYLLEKEISLYDQIVKLLEQHKEGSVYTELNDHGIEEVVKAITGDYPEYVFAWKNECEVVDCENQPGRIVKIQYHYDKSKTKVLRHSINTYIRDYIFPYVKNAGCRTEKEIVSTVYEYLSGRLVYTEKKIVRNGKTTFPHYAYTLETLCNLEGVCQGIALSLIYILRMYEIECLYIRGRTDSDDPNANGGAPTHGWCMVKLDGVYYHLDLTWDLHKQEFSYFLLTDAEMYMRHHRWDYAEYPKAG